jgi:hypothetical protein
MNMAARPEDMRRVEPAWRYLPARMRASPLDQSMAALQGAGQASMMMLCVWPMILAMPFFWAPPLFVLASGSRK